MSGAPLPPPPPESVSASDSAGSQRAPSPPPPPPQLGAPAGYVGYTAAQGYRDQLNPITKTARWAMILAAITGIASLASAFVSANLASKAQDFLDGTISEDAFLDANSIAPIGQILSTGPMVAAGVFGMIWMFRLSKNVRTLGRATTFAPVFAIVGWLLPPFLFVVPLLVLRELWKASDPNTPPGADGWRASGENPLLYLWFVLYGVVPAVLTVFSVSSVLDATLNLDTDTQSIAEVAAATSAPLLILTGAITLVSAGVWIVVVKQLTERHVALTGER
ncbi:DUF4328 domain-containing protein [Ilumatobacter sp.]|uniref:DUF4328 domain-containing protein n=1 Tax=Ilumatobacter sp. TaxID=1967498 RepID=UPI003C4AF479